MPGIVCKNNANRLAVAAADGQLRVIVCGAGGRICGKGAG
jgi:hypothetical protein